MLLVGGENVVYRLEHLVRVHLLTEASAGSAPLDQQRGDSAIERRAALHHLPHPITLKFRIGPMTISSARIDNEFRVLTVTADAPEEFDQVIVGDVVKALPLRVSDSLTSLYFWEDKNFVVHRVKNRGLVD